MSPATIFFELLLFGLVSGSLLLFVLGFISPDKSLFWLKGKRTRVRSAVIYAIAFAAGLLLLNTWYPAPPASEKPIADKANTYRHHKTDEQIAEEVLEKTGKIYTKNLIKSSTIYTYDALPENIRKLAPESGRLASDAPTENESVEIPKRKGYYIQLVLDNKLLAKASASKVFKEKQLLDRMEPHTLYGASRNSFVLFNAANTEIKGPEKHTGFNVFYVKRDYNIDTICIGPCIEKPAKVRINCYQQSQVTDLIEHTF